MKYYLSDNCYWDDEKYNIHRNGVIVKITPNQRKILKYLIRNNGRMVSHEELYSSLNGEEAVGDYKTSLSNLFTRNKSNEKGLLIRVPELVDHFETSKSQIGGGYKITIPQENIIEDASKIEITMDPTNESWYSTEALSAFAKENTSIDDEKQSRMMYSYLRGGRCTWPIVFYSHGNNPVKRSITASIKEYIKSNNGAIVLTGAGGEGKSTILMQLCVDLYKEGVNVLYHKATYKYGINTIFSDDVYIIDNPNNSGEFLMFLADAITCGATVVFALRSNEWNILKENIPDETSRGIKEFSIPRIDNIEAPLFAQCIKTNINKISRNEDKLTALFLDESYGFLYASMLMALYDKDSLEDITFQMLKRINDYEKSRPCLNVLASIVFFEKCQTPVNSKLYKRICKTNKVEERDPKYYLKMELTNNGANYQTRHEVISQLFYKFLFQEGEWKPFLSEDEKQSIINEALNWALYDFDKATTEIPDYSKQVTVAYYVIKKIIEINENDEETIEFIIQRTVESCRKFGYSLIYKIYRTYKTQYIGDRIAEKCCESGMFVWQIYLNWISRLLQGGEINKVRDIYKMISTLEGPPVSMWLNWGQFEENEGNIGLFDQQYSAAWIYYQAYESYEDFAAVVGFALFLDRHSELSFDETPEEILRKACFSEKSTYAPWIAWAKLMEQKGNIGPYDKEGTAAWIYNKAANYPQCNKEGSMWTNWVRTTITYPEQFPSGETLRVLELGCLEYNATSDVWNTWSKYLLDKGEIGDYSIEKSAAWVLKQCCLEHNATNDPGPWFTWIQFSEENYEKIGGYSPIELVRMACIEYSILSADLWLLWAKMETNCGNIGNYSEECSAAWIHKKVATEYFADDARCWIRWARFISEHLEDKEDSESYTPEEIIEMGIDKNPDSTDLWTLKARKELDKGNVGDYLQENSAAWLYKKACYVNETPTRNANSWLEWAKFANDHPMYIYNDYVDGSYIINLASKECEAFSHEDWLSLQDFKRKIDYKE